MRDLLTLPALLGGALLITEAIVSPWMGPHWGYHALNVPLSAAVALAAFGSLRRQADVPRVARVGAWIAVVTGAVAAAGGLVPLALEPTGLGSSPGIVEGIVHTSTLATFLGLALWGLGAAARPGPARVPMAVLGGAALTAVVMVLSGLDSPWAFLVVEALAGVGLAWLGLEANRAPARGAATTA